MFIFHVEKSFWNYDMFNLGFKVLFETFLNKRSFTYWQLDIISFDLFLNRPFSVLCKNDFLNWKDHSPQSYYRTRLLPQPLLILSPSSHFIHKEKSKRERKLKKRTDQYGDGEKKIKEQIK